MCRFCSLSDSLKVFTKVQRRALEHFWRSDSGDFAEKPPWTSLEYTKSMKQRKKTPGFSRVRKLTYWSHQIILCLRQWWDGLPRLVASVSLSSRSSGVQKEAGTLYSNNHDCTRLNHIVLKYVCIIKLQIYNLHAFLPKNCCKCHYTIFKRLHCCC